jgi:hypothetical protein
LAASIDARTNHNTGGIVAETKTKPTGESVTAFIKRLEGDERRKDCAALVRLMKQASGAPARMYGPAIVGFGSQPIQYADGKTAAWPMIAFSPRKQALTLYVGASKTPKALLGKLGKHKVAGGCLHIKRLSDVDLDVLTTLVSAYVKKRREA